VIFGHFGLAAGVRGGWPRTALVWLLPASIAPDLLDVILAAARICNPYGLYSHTLPAVVLIAALVGGAAYLTVSGKADATAASTAMACILVILLHPTLDFLTGHKLFWPGGELRGLHLYDRPMLDFLLESAVVVVGWLLLRRTPAAPRWAAAPAALCTVLLLQGAADLSAGSFKPSACAVEAVPAL
jgi:hypothetical protein